MLTPETFFLPSQKTSYSTTASSQLIFSSKTSSEPAAQEKSSPPALARQKEHITPAVVKAVPSPQSECPMRAEPNNLPYEQSTPVADTKTPANTRTGWELHLDTLNEKDRKSKEDTLELYWSTLSTNKDEYDFLRTDTLGFMKMELRIHPSPLRDELRRRLIAQKNLPLSPWEVYLESLDHSQRKEERKQIDRYWFQWCSNDGPQRIPLENGPHLSELERRLIARDENKLSSPDLSAWELYVNLLYPESKNDQCRTLLYYWDKGLALDDKHNFLQTYTLEYAPGPVIKTTVQPGPLRNELCRRLVAQNADKNLALGAGSGR